MFTVAKPNGQTRSFPTMREAQKHALRVIHCWPNRDVLIRDADGTVSDIYMYKRS